LEGGPLEKGRLDSKFKSRKDGSREVSKSFCGEVLGGFVGNRWVRWFYVGKKFQRTASEGTIKRRRGPKLSQLKKCTPPQRGAIGDHSFVFVWGVFSWTNLLDGRW